MWSRLLICVPLLLSTVAAQEPAGATTAAPELTAVERSLGTLAALQRSREAWQQELLDIRARFEASTNEDERLQLFEQANDLDQRLSRITFDYESVATGIDVRAFDMAPPEIFDLPGELEKLVQPLVEELKDATESPRRIERLRSDLAHLERRGLEAGKALASIESLIDALTEDDALHLRASLLASHAAWEARVEDIRRDQSVARFQLESRMAQRTSILDSTRSVLGNFFRTRGLNLLLAVSTFLLALILLRGLHRTVLSMVKGRTQDERPFYSRLLNVLFLLLSGIVAVAAALLVLYATGDWVLLGVTLAFIVGVAWAGKTAVPMFLEQIRLLLNLGTVRERERVIIDGIPYRVSRLSFYTLLANPELAGGVRRLPLGDLADMRSRTSSKDEIWFPCKRHDWVLLPDGTRGQIRHQSPDSVQLELLGGSYVTYPTTEFLSLAPQNLSAGFRVSERFGIDYAHQSISTSEVPDIFRADLHAGLEAQFGPDAVRGINVEFVEAGASSLDYAIMADMDGSSARDYDAIKRAIQRLCVDTCNDRGWGIPFTQITLHQVDV